MLVVRSGYIARQEIDSRGRAHVILTCSDGDVIGLGAALRAGRWAWTGLAITDVEVNLVERELFEDLYHRFPDLAVQQQPGGSVLLCKTGRCQRRRIRRLAWRARAVCKPGNARANSATCSDWANSSAQTASATAVSVTHERAPTTSATRLHSNGYTVQ